VEKGTDAKIKGREDEDTCSTPTGPERMRKALSYILGLRRKLLRSNAADFRPLLACLR
jgi:hypothetical protein